MLKIMHIPLIFVSLFFCNRIYSQSLSDVKASSPADPEAMQVFDIEMRDPQSYIPSFPTTEGLFCRAPSLNSMPESNPMVFTRPSHLDSNVFAPAERVVICGWNFPSDTVITVIITSPSGKVYELRPMIGEVPLWFFVPELSTTELGKYTISSLEEERFEAVNFYVQNSGPPIASILDKKIWIETDDVSQNVTAVSGEVTVVASGFPSGESQDFWLSMNGYMKSYPASQGMISGIRADDLGWIQFKIRFTVDPQEYEIDGIKKFAVTNKLLLVERLDGLNEFPIDYVLPRNSFLFLGFPYPDECYWALPGAQPGATCI